MAKSSIFFGEGNASAMPQDSVPPFSPQAHPFIPTDFDEFEIVPLRLCLYSLFIGQCGDDRTRI